MIPTTEKHPLLIGLAGGSASGKSTWAERLREALENWRVEVVPGDRYFLRPLQKSIAPVTGVEYDEYNCPESFDLEQLRNDLKTLAARTDLDVVIVEGLMTLQDEAVRGLLDLRLYVEAEADERIVRRLRRNMAHGLSFDEIAHYYLDSVRFRHQEFVEPSKWHADLILNGSQFRERGLEVLVAWIEKHLASG